MTDQLTDNEVIARFDGREEGYDEHGVWQKLRYNSDWRDLMPVWYKFRDLKMDLGLSEYKTYKWYWYELANDIPRKPIADVCKLLAEGIRWYNSVKK
jgi:hypothetical protein